MEKKRLFFGFSLEAPWPMTYPKGRIIDEDARHITLAFLGNHPFAPLHSHLTHCPKPLFPFGPIGICDRVLFLPELKPRVVSYHVNWMTDGEAITQYQTTLLDWLETLDYPVDRRPLLPHVTLARAPFEEREWEHAFEPLPCMITGIHLYESLGSLRYISIWHHRLQPVFEEFEHTADIAFHVRGMNYRQLYLHGALALSFKYPLFFQFTQDHSFENLDQVVQKLNEMISQCDTKIGCPFKAVSYHGVLKEEKPLNWEMIVDV